jgi:insertion element IS1 protein InsB
VKSWKCYFYVTDGWSVYPCFIAEEDQIVSKTYMTRVESENTRLRHYLARLHRKTLGCIPLRNKYKYSLMSCEKIERNTGESAMLNIPPEEKAQLDTYLVETAKILRKYTEPDRLNDFESIEIEVRNQMIEVVSPRIGEFFCQKEQKNSQERPEK